MRLILRINLMAHWIPLAVLTVFFGVSLLARSLLHRRGHGTFGIALFRGPLRQSAFELGLVILPAALLGEAALQALRPHWLGPRIEPGVALGAAGLGLAAAGLGL